MKKYVLIFAHCLILGLGFGVNNVFAKELMIMRACQHINCETFSKGEFYNVVIEGKHNKWGVIDDKGGVTIDWQQGKPINDGYFSLWSFGRFAFTVNANGAVTLKKMEGNNYADRSESSCKNSEQKCAGNGFYWVQLSGFSTWFADEFYQLSVQGKSYQGQVDKRGYLYLPYADPSEKMPITIAFCAGVTLNMTLGRNQLDSQAMWSQTKHSKPIDLNCEASEMQAHLTAYQAFNKGMPLAMAGWQVGLTPPERVALEKQERENAKQAKNMRYTQMAKANDDVLSWLGPLPLVWSDEAFEARREKFMEQLKSDVEGYVESLADNPLMAFECRKPTEVGDTPDMDAVNTYLVAVGEKNQHEIHKNLPSVVVAAKKGNWLARMQLSVFLSQKPLIKEPRVSAYRVLQLSEWLLEHKIGGIYRELSYALNATGMSSVEISPFEEYAALRHSYPAQYDVGVALMNESDPTKQALGKKMRDCALSALPAYQSLQE